MLEPDASAGSDAAVPRLIEDGYALGIGLPLRGNEVGIQIVQRLEVNQVFLMVIIHLTNAAVRVNRLIRPVQLALVQDASILLQRCFSGVQLILSSGRHLCPVGAVRLGCVQHRQVHGSGQISI